MSFFWQRALSPFILVTFASLLAFGGSAPRAEIIVDVDSSLTFVGDPLYAVNSRLSREILVPRAEALELIQAMNAGEIENFGYRDWRLATVAELHRLVRMEATFGDLSDLRNYLDDLNRGPTGGITARRRADDDKIYFWPVRAQVGPAMVTGTALLAISNSSVGLDRNSVWLERDSLINGDVTTNVSSAGATLISGFELLIDKDTAVSGIVRADRLKTQTGATATDSACNFLLDDSSNGFSCDPLDLPVFLEVPPFLEANPGSQDITLGNGESLPSPLAPGSYGHVNVGRSATLTLEGGGTYNFASFTVGADATVEFDAPAKVLIAGKLFAGKSTSIGPSASCLVPPGSACDATHVIFYVDGINGTSGAVFEIPLAAHVGGANGNLDCGNFPGPPDAGCTSIDANFYVRNGTFKVDSNTVLTGAVIALDVWMAKNTRVNTASAFEDAVANEVTAESQTVFTNGDENLEITLRGADPSGEDLSFAISSPPNAAVGSLLGSPVPIIPDPLQFCSVSHRACDDDLDCPVGEGFCADTFCSITRDQGCTMDSNCPVGEMCNAQEFPPINSALVTYDPVDDSNSFNSFEFTATNASGVSDSAEVLINDGGDPTDPPDDPVGTVVANDTSTEVPSNASVTVNLTADAPCDLACDGVGDDVPLTFSIVGGTPLTTADGGTVDDLIQGSEVPQRSATVSYTPAGGFVHTPGNPSDTFMFQACGTIGGMQVCDTATVTVVVVEPTPLAEDIGSQEEPVGVQTSTESVITLIGNSGGAGTPTGGGQTISFRTPGRIRLKAVGVADSNAVGEITDTDLDGDGDVTSAVLPRTVAVLENTADLSSPSLDNAAADLNSHYNSLPNVSSSLISGDITSLLGVDLLAIPVPDDSFTASEVSLMSSFLAGGGTILFMGENQSAVFDTANGAINSALTSLGSNMSIIAPGVADAGSQTATVANGQILSDPLTSGVNMFEYAAPSGVSAVAGGTTSLFLMSDLATTFVAKESVGGGLVVLSGDSNIIRTSSPIPADNGVFFNNLVNPATLNASYDGASETRIQIEWDVLDNLNPLDLVSARVILHTVKAANDNVDTFWHAGTEEQDAAITASDFEAPAEQIPDAVMPATGLVGETDTFEIDVLNAVLDAIDRDAPDRLSVFSIQGRVSQLAAGQGLSVRTDMLPQFEFSTPPPIFIPPLTFTITSLPTGVTLLDSNGSEVMVGVPLPSPEVTLVISGTTGTTSFTYQVEQDGVIDTATVFLLLFDNCAQVGRPPGCSPDDL